MIYYSAEARAYGLMMFLLTASTLSMLLALDTGRRRYWALYALCAAAAFYTHYTCSFVLAVQLLWALWAHPRARREALIATAGAAVLVIPWIPGLIADLQIADGQDPLGALAVQRPRGPGGHRALGGRLSVRAVPDAAIGGQRTAEPAGNQRARAAGARARLVDRRVSPTGCGAAAGASRCARNGDDALVLVFALMVATPVGEILGSAVGNHIIGVRDLAASWPFLALSGAAFVTAAGRRLGTAAAVLGLVAFALAASKMFETRFHRPDYQGAANYVAAHASAGDVVIDETGGLSPGPLTGFDVAFHRHLIVVRALRSGRARSPVHRVRPDCLAALSAEPGHNGRRWPARLPGRGGATPDSPG